MNFIAFNTQFNPFILFSYREIKKIFPDFYRTNLDDWQKKWYIRKIIRWRYYFTDQKLDERHLWMIANKIYEPSYISLHIALQYYGLIPEGVFTMTSISTKKTNEFTTPVGNFIYKKIRKDLMFGYKIIKINKLLYFKIAEIEKAILDFFYLNPHIYTENDFYELRIDCYELVKQRDEKKLERYLKTFNKKKLAETIHNFISYVKKNA